MKLKPLAGWLACTVFILAIVNFFAFVLIAGAIGGDALNGHEAGGHYFLANHGTLTEVNRSLFEYSKWHAISVLVTHPLAMLVAWIWSRQSKSEQP